MDSLGEVGKKMRSAIKAKLLELGTGSQTGYIDDELPDYVMIMVANKRSKSQMLTDLNLFLGSNTETFVNWLHQVLQKLQEVTLPNNLASKAKKKASDASSKKDKKKDKKKGSKEPSITDVIAVELMEKAKKTLEVESNVKKEGTRTPSPPPAPLITEKEPEPPTPPRINTPPSSESEKEQEDDEFNIPTISEIKTSAGCLNLHKKELSQLQELQNRIYQTKRKLRELDSDSEGELPASKKSVMSRLGVKPTENSKPSNIISLSAIRRTEKEIYVAPSFRKLIEKQKVDNDRREDGPRRSRVVTRPDRRSMSRSRSRDRHRNRRDRQRSPVRRSRSPRGPRSNIHQRIGSRVVVVSPERDAPMKVKQRPVLSSAITGQAGKNLLLRAVAEAQRSTALAAPELRKKPPRDNIVVQLPIRKDKRNIRIDEEYVPESLSTQSESEAEYRPTYSKSALPEDGDDGDDVIYLNNNEDVDLEDLDNDEMRKSPQFVVTLEGVTQFDNNSKSSHSPTPPPVIKRKSIKDRIGVRKATSTAGWEERQPAKRKTEEESESQRAYNRAKRARVSPIKFDLTDEDDDERKSRGTSRDQRSESPEMKDDDEDEKRGELNGEENAKRIRLEPSRSFDHVPALLSSIAVPVPESAKPITKSKDRCKFYPLCSNATCAFFHPTLPCKLFPNCKFGDSCAYVHPRCKFDTSCARVDCNFSHSQAVSGPSMPPIASSVVPVQNYKSISITTHTTICKFFPNCANTNCVFLHPKICKYGKGCMSKFDSCNFYHFETTSHSKFKWVSPLS